MIYALLMIVILDNSNIHIPERTYHRSLQECGEAGNVIARSHYLDGADKVYMMCKPYLEG